MPGVAQSLLDWRDRLGDERLRNLGENFRRQAQIDQFAAIEPRGDRCDTMRGQIFLGFARPRQEQAGVFDRQGFEFGGLENPAKNTLVEIVAAER